MTKKKGKKPVAAPRSPAPEAPRQPARRQETAEGSYDRFNLVLPPELSELAARIQVAQVRTTQPPPLRQVPATQSGTTLPPRQPPTTQPPPPYQPPATQSGLELGNYFRHKIQ